MEKQRDDHIDVIKGIGIILVVFGHNWIVLKEKGELFQAIYSFHMPLFFFIAGIFLHPKINFFDLIKNKANAILKPYASVCLVVGLVYLLTATPLSIQGWLGILYAEGQTLVWPWMWFLPSLFVSSITASLLIRALPPSTKARGNWLIIFVALLALGAMINRYLKSQTIGQIQIFHEKNTTILGFPFSLDLLPLTTSCIIAGYFLSDKLKKSTASWSMAFAVFLIFLAIHYFTPSLLDFNERVIISPATAILQAVCGIYLVSALAKKIQQQHLAKKIFSYLGRGSLFIFIFHFPAQAVLTFKLLKLFPEQPFLDCMTGLIAGIVFPLLIFEATNKNKVLATFLLPLRFTKTPSLVSK